MCEQLISILEKLNFSPIEAKIYMVLIKHQSLNGSQIAKKLNASRSSVYGALNNMYQRGVVYLLPGDTNLYRAETPEKLIDKIRGDFESNTTALIEGLRTLETEEEDSNYYNMHGTDNFINKAKEILLSAEKEVLMNTCIPLEVFKDTFSVLHSKGVRIIVYTFGKTDKGDLPIELFSPKVQPNMSSSDTGEVRLMLVVDLKTTLICSAKNKKMEMTGTFTADPLLANIVSEHIHHDIYLLRLQEQHGPLINEKIIIKSLLEKRGE